MMSFNNYIIVIQLHVDILSLSSQETNCIQRHFKFGAGANKAAANWFYITFPVKLDCK